MGLDRLKAQDALVIPFPMVVRNELSDDLPQMALAEQNNRMRSTNPVADAGRERCYSVGRWSSSKPREARRKTLASSRC